MESKKKDKMFFASPEKYATFCANSGDEVFRPGPTQSGLYSHRRWLEAGNFGLRKKRDCTNCVGKTKALSSCTVTAQLTCIFVIAYANIGFSNDAAHIMSNRADDCS